MAGQTQTHNMGLPSRADAAHWDQLYEAEKKRIRRRQRKDKRFKFYALAAIVLAGAFLVWFIVDLVRQGYPALQQAHIKTKVTYSPETMASVDLAFPKEVRDLVSRAAKREVVFRGESAYIQLPVHYSKEILENPAAAIKDVTITQNNMPPWIQDFKPQKVSRDDLLKFISEKGLQQIRQKLEENLKIVPALDAAQLVAQSAQMQTLSLTGGPIGSAAQLLVAFQTKKQKAFSLLGTTRKEWLDASRGLQQFLIDSTGLTRELTKTAELLDKVVDQETFEKSFLRRSFNAGVFGEKGKTIEEWVLADSKVDLYLSGFDYMLPSSYLKPMNFATFASFVGQASGMQAPGGSVVVAFPNATVSAELPIEELAAAEKRMPIDLEKAERINRLYKEGTVALHFNDYFFTEGDSKIPEAAGLRGAIIGSIYVLGLVFIICLPIGVMTSIYLEEFAPDNFLTRAIEVNINNLAAVPSILFGVLGLAVFINFFHMPRSSVLVGAATLAVMTLPVIIIATRASLRAVPDSIRHAAYAMGASRWQVVLHHVLPYSTSGILTGSIIGIAQAMGETAPLIIIGLVAFVPEAPVQPTDPTTVMPAQIFSWWSMSLRAFQERAALAILVLLGVLFLLNGLAVWIRARSERSW